MPISPFIGGGITAPHFTLNDGSQRVSIPGVSSEPVGNTYRGIGSDWFNAGNIEREDWQRNEQSLNNAFYRDLYKFGVESNFNASEAKKFRDWQHNENSLAWERSMQASNTEYQRAVADMKEAGINPILAFSQGGASSPTASAGSGSAGSASISSSAGGYRSSRRTRTTASADSLVNLLSGLVKAVGNFVLTKNIASAVASSASDPWQYGRFVSRGLVPVRTSYHGFGGSTSVQKGSSRYLRKK